MTLFDYVAIAIVGISLLLGLMRGAVKEIFSLVSWVVAFLAAKMFSVPVAHFLEPAVANSSLRLLTAFIILFIFALIVMALINLLISAAIKKIGLGPIDRLLGAIFGFVRGLLIMVVLVVLGGMTALPQQSDWRNALTSSWFEILATTVKPWLPDAMAKRIHFGAAPAEQAK